MTDRDLRRREPLWLRVIDRLSAVMALLAGMAAVGLMGTILTNVVMRKVAGSPLPGTLDLSAYLWMPVLTALAMGYALRKHEHVRVSLLTEQASGAAQRLTEVFSLFVTTALVAVLAYYAFVDATTKYGFREVANGSPWLPIWPMRYAVAVGLTVFAAQALAELVRSFRPPGAGVPATATEEHAGV